MGNTVLHREIGVAERNLDDGFAVPVAVRIPDLLDELAQPFIPGCFPVDLHAVPIHKLFPVHSLHADVLHFFNTHHVL